MVSLPLISFRGLRFREASGTFTEGGPKLRDEGLEENCGVPNMTALDLALLVPAFLSPFVTLTLMGLLNSNAFCKQDFTSCTFKIFFITGGYIYYFSLF